MSGGKNSAKRSTRMPTALAAAKWPNSCRMISAAKPAKARNQDIRRAPPICSAASSRASRSASNSDSKARTGPPGICLQRRVDHVGDAGERQAAVEERVDGDLVGGVEDARRGAAGAARPRGTGRRHGNASWSTSSKVSEPSSARFSRRVGSGMMSGWCKRVGDRDPHVGQAEVRELRAVGGLDQRVDDRLRVHDDVDAVVGDAEEVVGLHDLEALVHQRGRVDGDLAAHRPRRVVERLLDGDVGQLGARAAAERAARGGDRHALQRAGRHAVQQVVQRGVLGVDRQQPRARGLGELGDELAADDQRLLVGQREVDALPQRRDRRARGRPSRPAR